METSLAKMLLPQSKTTGNRNPAKVLAQTAD